MKKLQNFPTLLVLPEGWKTNTLKIKQATTQQHRQLFINDLDDGI